MSLSNEIIPAILPQTESDLIEKIEILEGVAPLIHLDVLEEDIWEETRQEFEAHLMVEDPEAIFGRWADRGAKRIAVHSLSEEIFMHQHLAEIGLALTLDTPLDEVFDLISRVDYLHLMSIAEIGEQGHPFDDRIFDRIKKVREIFPEVVIAVDGGIDLEHAEKLLQLGADRLVVGSAIYGESDPEEAFEQFLNLIQ